MGGLGFSHYANIAFVMYQQDINQTFEGDNHVLLMQAARMILKNVVWMHKGKHLLETMEYLSMSDPTHDQFKVEQNAKSLIRAF